MKVTLQSIAKQGNKDTLMEELFAGEITLADGLWGDDSAACGEGEVTVLSRESWINVCIEADMELPWLAHGANLLIKGFEFLPTDLGRTLRIGQTELQISREQEPGQHLEAQAPQLFEALQSGWRGGVVCRVLKGGLIQIGDAIEIIG